MNLDEELSNDQTPQNKHKAEFNRELCLDHIAKIHTHLDQFKGKRGMNPYLWIAKHLTPLVNRLDGINKRDEHGQPQPEETLDLQQAILSVRTDAIPKYGIQPADEDALHSDMKKQLPTLGRTF